MFNGQMRNIKGVCHPVGMTQPGGCPLTSDADHQGVGQGGDGELVEQRKLVDDAPGDADDELERGEPRVIVALTEAQLRCQLQLDGVQAELTLRRGGDVVVADRGEGGVAHLHLDPVLQTTHLERLGHEARGGRGKGTETNTETTLDLAGRTVAHAVQVEHDLDVALGQLTDLDLVGMVLAIGVGVAGLVDDAQAGGLELLGQRFGKTAGGCVLLLDLALLGVTVEPKLLRGVWRAEEDRNVTERLHPEGIGLVAVADATVVVLGVGHLIGVHVLQDK